ncbi:MAG TPA: hemerythrin [Planctomycetaceae bacterium]|nr:hemerythrin [Planctomycetaceae bacterium]
MTQYMVWRPAYSVGSASIDNQHKQIIQIINDLHEAMGEGDESAALRPLVERLLAYTDMHFEFEEQVMEECGYPDLEYHRHQHDELRHRTEDLQRYLGLVTGPDLFYFLREWWLDHIQEVDRRYSAYLKAAVLP